MAAWVMCSFSAAARKLPSLATHMKASTKRVFMASALRMHHTHSHHGTNAAPRRSAPGSSNRFLAGAGQPRCMHFVRLVKFHRINSEILCNIRASAVVGFPSLLSSHPATRSPPLTEGGAC